MRRLALASIAAATLIAIACTGEDPLLSESTETDAGSTSGSSGTSGTSGLPVRPDAIAPPQGCGALLVKTLAGNTEPGGAHDASVGGDIARFNAPVGIAVDESGPVLLVADKNNAAIRTVSVASGTVDVFFRGGDLKNPVRLVHRGTDQFIADQSSSRMYRLTNQKQLVGMPTLSGMNTVAMGPGGAHYATGSTFCQVWSLPGSANAWKVFSGKGAPCTSADAVDGKADAGTFSNRVVDLAFGPDSAPWTLYVADDGHHVIRKVDSTGSVATFVGSGEVGTRDGKGTEADFSRLGGIAFDEAKNVLYVTDKTRIRAVAEDGTVTTVAGTTDPGTADGPGCLARFTELEGIATYGGVLYVVDKNRVRKVSPVAPGMGQE